MESWGEWLGASKAADLVSIIIPVYNRAAYLSACLESLLCQTWKHIEIITVDDGSTDQSAEILDEFSSRDARVKVIRNPHGGAGKARNAGLRAANGDYLMFVDSDDYVDPRFVERMLCELIEKEADIVQCCYARVTDGIPQKYVPVTETVCLGGRELCKMQVSFVGAYTPSVVAWNKIYRRELWRGIWFDETHTFEDIFTSYKVIYPVKRIVLIQDVLYNWVIHSSSTSLNDYSTERCADVIRAWMEKNDYFAAHNERELVLLNKRRCCYVSAQHIYMLKKARLSEDAIAYHRKVIKECYPDLIREKRWSMTTRFRLWLTRTWPWLFGWISKTHKLDLEK